MKISKGIKTSVRKLFRFFGLEIGYISTNNNPSYQLLKALEKFDIDLIFDIGANAGQFSRSMRHVGYTGDIVSFEPLLDAFEELTIAAARDSKWQIHPRSAIGDFDGEVEINISGNSVSSSILPMLPSHATAAADSAYIGKISTLIYKFDTVANKYLKDNKKNYFIKIDTHGFEWQVLDGAEVALSNALGVLCELSLVALYENQHLWTEIIERLKSKGFTLWALQEGFIDPRDGRTLQVDAIFFRI